MSMSYSDPLKDYAQRVKNQVEFELRFEMLSIAGFLKTLFTNVVRDWQHKPVFKTSFTREKGYMEIVVTATGENAEIFEWVDAGTKGPYVIRPKSPDGVLKFRSRYDAKTQPVALFGVGSGKQFGQWRTEKFVIHPGIQAREFMKTAERELETTFEKRILEAMNRGIRKVS